MERCPACKARLREKTVCRRCGADVSTALSIKTGAGEHFNAAIEAFVENHADAMLYHAKRAFSKRRTPETSKLLACAAILAGDIELAFRAWRSLSL